MKATTQIEVKVEIEESDAALLYNNAVIDPETTEEGHRRRGEIFRQAMQEIVDRAVRAGVNAYINATK